MTSVLDIVVTAVDGFMAAIPRAEPERAALERCCLISHRGEHDNVHVMENTLAAFDRAQRGGVWGLECDIRWTGDLVPVICHDATPGRVFGVDTLLADTPIAEVSFNELRRRASQIPSLRELVEQFGGKMHLMLELKQENWPDAAVQAEILRDELAPLMPGENYQMLSLDPDMFARLPFVSPRHCLPVAELNVGALSRYALAQGCAGIGGHYLLLNERLRLRHGEHDQRLGTGFPGSRNCLYRELNRGIEWVFSNNAVAMQRIVDEALDRKR